MIVVAHEAFNAEGEEGRLFLPGRLSPKKREIEATLQNALNKSTPKSCPS